MSLKNEVKITDRACDKSINYLRHNQNHRENGLAYISLYPLPYGNYYLYGTDAVGSSIFLEIEYFRSINDAWDNPVKMRDIPPAVRVQWLRYYNKDYKQSRKIVTKDEAIKHLQLIKNPKGFYKAGRYGHYDAFIN